MPASFKLCLKDRLGADALKFNNEESFITSAQDLVAVTTKWKSCHGNEIWLFKFTNINFAKLQ